MTFKPTHTTNTVRGLLFCLLLFAVLPVLASGTLSGKKPAPAPALVLGSGGASGLAHIAILRVFDEKELQPARISGSSIGAVIGALYAAGLSADEIEQVFRDFDGEGMDLLLRLAQSELGLKDVFNSGVEGGLLDASGLLNYLAGKVDARTFDDLQIPLSVVATDFWTGEAVVIDEGNLFQAVEASMAVPGLFKPVRRDDQLLLDGGMSNPLPFDIFPDDMPVIAVDVSGNREKGSEKTGTVHLLFKTFEIMQQSIVRQMRKTQEPDLYLKPDTGDVQLLHFNRLSEILEKTGPEADKLCEYLSDS